ncbi:MAG: hypothetical protein IPJ98_17225 [Bryobacterales bacterium]|nr:hypothetical protein [Bryobacterales bacterium]
MLIAALLLVILIPFLAASVRVVPKDMVGLVERLGRLVPVVRGPGLMVILPFMDRLTYFPSTAFPLHIPVPIEPRGTEPLELAAECACTVADAVRFRENLPFSGVGPAKQQAGEECAKTAGAFLQRVMAADGEAAVAEAGVMNFLSDLPGWADRLRGPLKERGAHVGLRFEGLRISAKQMTAEEMWRLRRSSN